MKKFRVGVIVNEFVPEVGGAHNFVQAVANALPFGDSKSEDLEFILLVENQKNDLGSEFGIGIRRSRWIEARILQAYRYNLGSTILRFLDQINPLSRAIRRNRIDFLFFLGSSALPTSVPFGVIVWDVQHRTHPWFPELQPGWNSREELAKLVLPRASIVITGTTVGRDELVSFYGISERNIFILPHPVPEDVQDFNRASFNRDFTFIYPAQFWPHKNHVVILEAMKYLNLKNLLNFKVIFVGADKGNLAYINELIDLYELSENIEIKGFVSRAYLLSLYRQVDALVYSSYSGPENLPPLEAFKSSLPVIYADFPGSREQLGTAALFFNPWDHIQLAQVLLTFMQDDSLKFDLVLRGKRQLEGRTSADFSLGLVRILKNFHLFRRTWK